MSYDVPFKRETYSFPLASFGATTASRKLRGPRGKQGTVKDIRVTGQNADFVGTTSVPEVNVGSAASVAGGTLYNEYARFRLGTTATAGYASANGPYRARAIFGASVHPGGVPPVVSDFAGHVELEKAKIPANSDFYITTLAGVGGTPAGGAIVEVDVDWD